MTKRSIVARVLVASMLTAASVWAQAPAPPPTVPTLQDGQKQAFVIALKDVEIAQLRLEKAVAAAQKLFTDAQRPGYVLDLQSLTYSPEKPATPAAPAKEDE